MCSGNTNGPASSTRIRRLRVVSEMKRCSATTQPNVPPPTTMVSNSRVRPPTTCPALSSASCKVLQRKRPMLSNEKVVDSEGSNGAITCHSLLCVRSRDVQPTALGRHPATIRSGNFIVDKLKLVQNGVSVEVPLHRVLHLERPEF